MALELLVKVSTLLDPPHRLEDSPEEFSRKTQIFVDALPVWTKEINNGIVIPLNAVVPMVNEIVINNPAIQEVYKNLNHIRVNSDNMPKIVTVSTNMTQLLAIHGKLTELLAVYAKLAQIQTCHTNINQINTVATNMTQLLAVHGKLTQIQAAYDNMSAIIAAPTQAANAAKSATAAAASATAAAASVADIRNNLLPRINEVDALLKLQMPYLKTVADADAQIRANANNIASIDTNATHMKEILAVNTRLVEVKAIADNITKVIAAESYAVRAEEAALRAESVADVGFATELKAGIVKLNDSIKSISKSEAATPNAVRQVAELAEAARVSSESWTLTTAVAAGGQITLPRGYIVGKKGIMLFKGGMLIDYTEVGTFGKWSTVCKLKSAAAVGDVFTMVGPLGNAPSVVLDFEGGAWPKELVCSRATVDYVFDDAGKVQEIAANTPAITKDPVTGRKGLQLFGQRTRLNKYYKSATNWAHNSARGTSLGQKEDLTSPTLTCVHCTYDKSKDSRLTGYYFRYNLFSDIGTDPLLNDTKYSIIICAKASYGVWTVHIQDKIDDSASETPSFDISVTEEYTVITKTIVVKAGKHFQRIDIQNSISNTADTAYIDIAYLQIEQSAIPTPLIAGAEGVQVTVGDTVITSSLDNIYTEFTSYVNFITGKYSLPNGWGIVFGEIRGSTASVFQTVGLLSPDSELRTQALRSGAPVKSEIVKVDHRISTNACLVMKENFVFTICNGIRDSGLKNVDDPTTSVKMLGDGRYSGYIITYWSFYNKALPDSELIELTTPTE